MEETPTFLENFMKQAKEEAGTMMPKCHLCSGHLAGGALTVPLDNSDAIVICMKCNFKAVNFYLREREKRLKEPADSH